MVSAYVKCRSISFRSSLANMRDWWHGHSLFAGRRSTALIHRCRLSLHSYPAEPLLTLFDPPIELASLRPHGRLHLDRRIDSSAIRCGMLLHLVVAEIHIRLEHDCDSRGREPPPARTCDVPLSVLWGLLGFRWAGAASDGYLRSRCCSASRGLAPPASTSPTHTHFRRVSFGP